MQEKTPVVASVLPAAPPRPAPAASLPAATPQKPALATLLAPALAPALAVIHHFQLFGRIILCTIGIVKGSHAGAVEWSIEMLETGEGTWSMH